MLTQILIWIASAISILLMLLVLGVAMRRADFKIARSQTMSASPDKVFQHVNTLRLWEAWSPWAKLDPHMKQTNEGPAAGTGAVHTWDGDNKVGSGRMSITAIDPGKSIQMQLQFIRPFQCENQVQFTFEPRGAETLVTWNMTGRNNFMAKLFDLFMNMDKMVGKDFEKGLASLKQVVESQA